MTTEIQKRIEQMVTNGGGYINYMKTENTFDDQDDLDLRLAIMGERLDDFLIFMKDYSAGTYENIIPKYEIKLKQLTHEEILPEGPIDPVDELFKRIYGSPEDRKILYNNYTKIKPKDISSEDPKSKE